MNSNQESWTYIHDHDLYGDQLGLPSDDEDYIDPSNKEIMISYKAIDMNDKSIKQSDISEVNKEIANNNGPVIVVSNADSTSSPSKLRLRKKETTISSSNNIPTDITNSSDSEDESNSFVCTAECNSMHDGKQLVHTILPINVDNLLTMLFSKSTFFAEFHKLRRTTNMIYRDWIDNADGTKSRTLNFTVAVTQPVGPKTSNVLLLTQT